jgi:hypothetical protein
VKDKPGRLEAIHRRTVFLDEIADLSAPQQTKFLRFVQEQRSSARATMYLPELLYARNERRFPDASGHETCFTPDDSPQRDCASNRTAWPSNSC